MVMRRVIPCLDVQAGRVVKGIRFQGLRDAGDPAELAARYEEDGADEITLLDISATEEARSAAADTVARVRRVLAIPLTVGGGVRTEADAASLLGSGADKVAINSAGVERPGLISECAGRFGSQCVVVAIDAREREHTPKTWGVVTHSGTVRTRRDALEWAREAAGRGAGELLITSWDRDGTRAGYDIELTRSIAASVTIPVIASGGAAGPDHLLDALRAGADAVLAASIFHDGQYTARSVKRFLASQGMEVRL